MFDKLLESSARSERFTGGAIASASAHAAIIAMAVLATAKAHVPMSNSTDAIHAVYFPPKTAAGTLSREQQKSAQPRLPKPIETKWIDVRVPTIDIASTPMSPVELPSPGNGGPPAQHRNASGSNSNAPFQADQVEKQVAFIQGSAAPHYPEALRSSGVEGQVVALFVVDATGHAETDTVRFVRSNNRLFEEAVRAALSRMRFVPAEIGGRKVRQLVQMPFVFTIDR